MATKKSIKKEVEQESAAEMEVKSPEVVKTEKEAPAKEPAKEPVKEAQVAPKAKAKLYEIKFLKNHEFNVGVVAYVKKKDEKMKVERHLANTFSSRGIAVIID